MLRPTYSRFEGQTKVFRAAQTGSRFGVIRTVGGGRKSLAKIDGHEKKNGDDASGGLRHFTITPSLIERDTGVLSLTPSQHANCLLGSLAFDRAVGSRWRDNEAA
jgi:hypothetical protein